MYSHLMKMMSGPRRLFSRRADTRQVSGSLGRQRGGSIVTAAIEGLEGRILYAVNTWALPSGGDWDTASNWSLGHVPTASEDAVIPNLGPLATIHHDDNVADSVHSITTGTGLVIGGGSLTIATSVQDTESIHGVIIDGGTLSVGTTLQSAVNITLDSGTIRGGIIDEGIAVHSGTLDGVTLAGQANLGDGGSLNVLDGVTFRSGGAIVLGGTTQPTTLTFADTAADLHAVIGGTGAIVMGGFDSIYNSVIYNNSRGGTLTLGSGVSITGAGTLNTAADSFGAGSGLINDGTIDLTTNDATLNIIGNAFTNAGTLTLAGSKSNLAVMPNTWTNTGTFSHPGTGFLQVGGTITGNITLDAKTGSLYVLNGAVFKNATLSFPDFSANLVAFPGTPVLNLNNVTIGSGWLVGQMIPGSIPANPGTGVGLSITNGLTLTNDNQLFVNDVPINFNDSADNQTIAGNGEITLHDDDAAVIFDANNGHNLTIGPGVIIDNGSGGTQSSGGVIETGSTLATSHIINKGFILGNALTPLLVNAPLINEGTIAPLFGSEVDIDTGPQGFAWQNAAGGTLGGSPLGIPSSGILRLGGSFTNAGAIDTPNTTVIVAGTLNLAGMPFTFNPSKNGTWQLAPDGSIDNGILSFVNGASLTELSNSAPFGELSNDTIASNLEAPAGVSLVLAGTTTLANNAMIGVGGTLYVDISARAASLAGTGQVDLQSDSSRLVLLNGATSHSFTLGQGITVQGSGVITTQSGASDTQIINNGTIADDNANLTFLLPFGAVTNNGTIDLGTGSITLSGSLNDEAEFVSDGTIRTTLSGPEKAGIILATESTSIDLEGGLLDVYVASGYHPAIGTKFGILQFYNLDPFSGGFAHFDGLSLGGGVSLQPGGIGYPAGGGLPLYELNAVAAAPDTIAPTVLSSSFPTPPTTGSAVYQFTVTYSDNAAINVATLSSTNIKVTGPKSYSQFATLVSVSKTNNGTPRSATYQILAPTGGWSTAANGTFTATLQANSVKDTSGNAVASRVVGTFKVA